RQALQYEPQAVARMEDLQRDYEEFFRLQPGKMVLELKPHGADKGKAVRKLMRQTPFAGHVPIFCGDDQTDEAAFHATQEAGGAGIKIGAGDSIAHYRLPNPAALQDWLREALAGTL